MVAFYSHPIIRLHHLLLDIHPSVHSFRSRFILFTFSLFFFGENVKQNGPLLPQIDLTAASAGGQRNTYGIIKKEGPMRAKIRYFAN